MSYISKSEYYLKLVSLKKFAFASFNCIKTASDKKMNNVVLEC